MRRRSTSGPGISVTSENYAALGALVRMPAASSERDTGRVKSFSLCRRAARVSQRQLIPGSYLTDGQRLFRVLSRLVDGRSTLVSIEDCLTLETRAYAASELGTMPLRPVRGATIEVTA